VHNETLFDSSEITESGSSREKYRVIVQIGDDVAAPWKAKKQWFKFSSWVMFMLNRMYSWCASESSDDENRICRNDPWVSELFSVWIVCAFWDENREVELEVQFRLVGFLDYIWHEYNFKIEYWDTDELGGMRSKFTPFIWNSILFSNSFKRFSYFASQILLWKRILEHSVEGQAGRKDARYLFQKWKVPSIERRVLRNKWLCVCL
jgi:hypothetical protein